MASEIYNEGRVVGFSAYESYIRQHVASLGDTMEPATEREWLASMLAGGSALLVKVPSGISTAVSHQTGWHYFDIPLPANCRLCAANTVVGYLFEGHGYYANDSLFATRIESYGDLVSNTSARHPSTTSTTLSNVPVVDGSSPIGSASKARLYSKIVDGIIVQPGKWSTTSSAISAPAYYLKPNYQGVPGLRIKIAVYSKDQFNEDIEILLVGLTNRSVDAGEVGQLTSSGSDHPADGDFLGPTVFPWAVKVMFVTPSCSAHFIHEEMDNISHELYELGETVSHTPNTTAAYQDISIPQGTLVPDIIVKNGIVAISVNGVERCLGLSMKGKKLLHTLTNAAVVNDGVSDGYIYWDHLVQALHYGSDGSDTAKVDALTSYLRDLNSALKGQANGQYVLNVEGGTISLSPYVFSEDDMIKLKMNVIMLPHGGDTTWVPSGQETKFCGYCRNGTGTTYQCIDNNGQLSPLFCDVKLDMFGYVAEYNNGASSQSYYSYTLNMLSTLSLTAFPSVRFPQPCNQWAQRFYFSDSTNIASVLNVVLALRKGKMSNTGYNTILFASGGRPLLRTDTGTIWDGSPLCHMDIALYINIKGIVQAINTAETLYGNVVNITNVTILSPVANIGGVLFGRADETSVFSAGSKVSSCSCVGAISMSDKETDATDAVANVGLLEVTAKFEDDTTHDFQISLTSNS